MILSLPIALAGAIVVQTPAPSQPTVKPSARSSATAFVHVSIVPMDDTDRVLEDQTVIVRGDRIVALGPAATTPVPPGATRIDGRGKYLIPGLADMHAHVGDGLGGPATERRTAEDQLFVYAADGVTTIRNVNYVNGFDSLVLKARGLAAAGKLWSPRIYASGDWLTDKERSVAENLVAYQAAGYDFIKVHTNNRNEVPGPGFDSLFAAAHLLGIPVMGHVEDDDRIPKPALLLNALALGFASIEHLLGYPGGGLGPSAVTADTVQLPALIAATARAGVWNCPTEALYAIMANLADTSSVAWLKLRHRIIKGLQDAGGGLLLGTDGPGLMPITVHHELRALVDAGLTPYQALATGTRNVAAYFGKLRDEGTVAIGKRADLVLLNGNPLQDIRNTASPAGTMLNGRWLSRAAIDRRLAAIAAANPEAAKDRAKSMVYIDQQLTSAATSTSTKPAPVTSKTRTS